jgi:glycosyltransferase involved in cell wall biosynthesis
VSDVSSVSEVTPEPDTTTWLVVPTFNGNKFLMAAVESIRTQTIGGWRAVIVDDGSTDDTLGLAFAVAKDDDRFRVIHQDNAGVASARNRGLECAMTDSACDSVLFLDCDDQLVPTALAELRHGLATATDCPAVHGFALGIDERGDRLDPDHVSTLTWSAIPRVEPSGPGRRVARGCRLTPVPLNEKTTFDSLCSGTIIRTPGLVLIRRSALEVVGPFDREMSPCDDWDMWLRLTRRLGGMAFSPTPVLRYRVHGANLSADASQIIPAERRVWKKAWSCSDNTLAQRQALRAGYRARQLSLSVSKLRIACHPREIDGVRGSMKQIAYGARHLAAALRCDLAPS